MVDSGAVIQEQEETVVGRRLLLTSRQSWAAVQNRVGHDAYTRIAKNEVTEDDLIRASRSLQHYHAWSITI